MLQYMLISQFKINIWLWSLFSDISFLDQKSLKPTYGDYGLFTKADQAYTHW